MAPRTTFANLADGLQNLSLWDQAISDTALLGTIPCTASGSNAITLTPVASVYPPSVTAYQAGLRFSFVPAATSTGSVTARVGTLAFLNVVRADGTQATTNDLVINRATVVQYNATATVFEIVSGSGKSVFTDATQTLTNKSIDTAGSNTIKVNGNTLAATAGTATVTVPNSTDTLVARATTDTLTNKTINGANNTLSNVALASLATQAANTLVGNATAGSAVPTAIDISALTTKTTPTSSDYTIISDQAASGALKKIAVQIPTWTNARLAKTAAYTVATTDVGSTIALGGTAFYALTIPAASGFSAIAAFQVLNEDYGRGKTLLPVYTTSATSLTIGTGSKAFTVAAGLTFPTNSYRFRAYSLANNANWMAGTISYSSTTLTMTVDATSGSGTFSDWQIAPEVMLWPQQSVTIYNQNNVWQVFGSSRWRIQGPLNFYVDTAGSNSNDGLATGASAFKTITAAIEALYAYIDGSGYTVGGTANARAVTILVTTGQNFTEAVSVIGQPTGFNAFTIKGNGGAFTWNSTTYGIAIGDNAEVILDTIAWNCNTSNAASTAAIMGHNNPVIDLFGAHTFIGNGANCSAIFTDNGGWVSTSNSALTFSGTFGDLIHMDKGGNITVGGALTPSGTVNVTRAYNLIGYASLYIGANMVAAGWTSIGASIADSSTGRRNGTTIQGGVTTANGGQWIV